LLIKIKNEIKQIIKMLINKNGKIYFIKETSEISSHHILRSWFIVNNINDNLDINELEKLSKMWIAINKYDCIYSDKYMQVIKELKKNYQI
jgi:hypothetical protein